MSNRLYGLYCKHCSYSLLIREGPYCDEIVCLSCWKPLCRNCGRIWYAKGGGLRHMYRGRRCRYAGFTPHILPRDTTITLDPINLIQESKDESEENMISGYDGDNDINNESMDVVEVETDEIICNTNGNGLCFKDSSTNTDIDTDSKLKSKQEINCDLDGEMSDKDEREWRYKLKDTKFGRAQRNEGYKNIHIWQSKRKYVKRTNKFLQRRKRKYNRNK